MKRSLKIAVASFALLLSCSGQEEPQEVEFRVYEPGSRFTTTINSEGIGDIVVQVSLPTSERYESGAPILIYTPTFFTPDTTGFQNLEGVTQLGFAEVTLLYPGRSDGKGHQSSGTDDFGGPLSLQALRDAILFANGSLTDSDGHSIQDQSAVTLDTSNIGLYAFSHPGIAATNVLATYPTELSFVDYLVGRENPTEDLLSTMELGYEENGVVINNSLYKYPASYSSDGIVLNYSSAQYDLYANRPYLDLNWNKKMDRSDYILGEKVPQLFGKRTYSVELLKALEANHAFASSSWPEDLATAAEAELLWASRETLTSYEKLPKSLRLMLVFGETDHVQVAADKPHIHQAYDGITEAGLWIRLNPDLAYMESVRDPEQLISYSDHSAGTEPDDWNSIGSWGHADSLKTLAPLAAVAEMADRSEYNNWEEDLTETLHLTYPTLTNDQR